MCGDQLSPALPAPESLADTTSFLSLVAPVVVAAHGVTRVWVLPLSDFVACAFSRPAGRWGAPHS